MAYTEQDRDRLKRAIASGVLTVDYPERGRVTYRSMPELKLALQQVETELAAAAGTPIARRLVATTQSGF